MLQHFFRNTEIRNGVNDIPSGYQQLVSLQGLILHVEEIQRCHKLSTYYETTANASCNTYRTLVILHNQAQALVGTKCLVSGIKIVFAISNKKTKASKNRFFTSLML